MKQPKIVYLRNGRVFVLGGTDFQDKVVGKCYEVVGTEIKEISQMNQPRRSFGCYVTNSHIYVAGGLYASFSATASCEVYDIDKNTWSELPGLPSPNFSLTLSMFKKNQLIAVGGTDEQKRPLNSIWILNLASGTKWQRINVALPQAVSEVGIFQQAEGKVLIFGGWNAKKLNQIYSLRENHESYQLSQSKFVIEKPDVFTLNGVWFEEDGDFLIPGHNFVHRVNYKVNSVKYERDISKE